MIEKGCGRENKERETTRENGEKARWRAKKKESKVESKRGMK